MKKFLSLFCAAAIVFTASANAFALSTDSKIAVDTGKQLAVLPGSTYQFKVTAASRPTFRCGTGSVFKVVTNGSQGNNYFFKVTAIGEAGESAGFYINNEKAPRTIGTIASADVKLDTGKQLSVQAGKTYQFKITSAWQPTFGCETGSVFQVMANGSNGNDYFFKVTAIGQIGQSAGFYVNHEKTPRTVGTIVAASDNNTGNPAAQNVNPTSNVGSNSSGHSHSGSSGSGGSSNSGGNSSTTTESVSTPAALQTALADSKIKTISIDQPVILDSDVTIPSGKTIVLNQKLTVNSTLNLAGMIQTPAANESKRVLKMAKIATVEESTSKLQVGEGGVIHAENGSSLEFASFNDIITPSKESVLLYAGSKVRVAGKQYVGNSDNGALIQLSNFDDTNSSPAAGYFLNGDGELLLVIFQKANVLKSDKNTLDVNLLLKAGDGSQRAGKLTIPNFDILNPTGGIVIESNAELIENGKSIVSANNSESVFNTTGGQDDNRRGIRFSNDSGTFYINIHGDVCMNRAFKINGTAPAIIPESFDADNHYATALNPTLKINFESQKGDFNLGGWYSIPAQGQVYREQTVDSNRMWVSKSDATLQSIRVDGQPLSDFDPNIKVYTVKFGSDTTSVWDLRALTTNAQATVSVEVTPSENLPCTVTFLVISEDGKIKNTYTINVQSE